MAPATLHIPHLCPVEVTSAFRGLALAKKIRIVRAAEALIDLADLPAMRHPVEPLLPRIWTLRANLTAYDAVYVALAEAVEAPLVTCDRKIAPKYAHHVQVEVID
jgi:predicted nucleic acid-binding protein